MKQKVNTDSNDGDFGLDMGGMVVPAQEMRCPGCGRFIGYQAIAWGVIKVKCPNCKEWLTYDVSPNK